MLSGFFFGRTRTEEGGGFLDAVIEFNPAPALMIGVAGGSRLRAAGTGRLCWVDCCDRFGVLRGVDLGSFISGAGRFVRLVPGIGGILRPGADAQKSFAGGLCGCGAGAAFGLSIIIAPRDGGG